MSKRIKFYLRVVPDQRTGPESFEIDDDQKVRLKKCKSSVFYHTNPQESSVIRVLQTIWFYNKRCPAINKLPFIKFETDGVFTDACQAFIYDTVLGSHAASSIHKSEDITILACGPNGTGKTYTMTGIRENYHFRGIIPRFIDTLFELKKKKDFTMRILALEFRNGSCYNLLSNPVQEVDCRKLTGDRLKSEKDTLELLFKAESLRRSASGENCGSLVVTILIKHLKRSQVNTVVQKIHLVDTAGSEVHWAKLQERPCLNRKSAQHSTFVFDPSCDWVFLTEKAVKGRLKPQNAFRNCQMVGYMYHSLRYGSVWVIGHVRRDRASERYTLATLKFGTHLTGRIEGFSSREAVGPSAMSINLSLENEVQRLRDELALTDLLENGVVPLTESQPDTSTLSNELENYLKSPELVPCDHLMTLAHPFTILGTCKTVYRRCLAELKEEYDLDGGNELMAQLSKHRIRGQSRGAKKKSQGSTMIDDQMISKLAVAGRSIISSYQKVLNMGVLLYVHPQSG